MPRTAIEIAEAGFAALGRAERIAEATVPFTDPARRHLVRRWHLYAWATREAPQHTPWFRDLLRSAVRGCRAARAA